MASQEKSCAGPNASWTSRMLRRCRSAAASVSAQIHGLECELTTHKFRVKASETGRPCLVKGSLKVGRLLTGASKRGSAGPTSFGERCGLGAFAAGAAETAVHQPSARPTSKRGSNEFWRSWCGVQVLWELSLPASRRAVTSHPPPAHLGLTGASKRGSAGPTSFGEADTQTRGHSAHTLNCGPLECLSPTPTAASSADGWKAAPRL